jgi:hypothetical protein
VKETRKLTDAFSWLNNLAEMSVHGQPIVLCHYAMRIAPVDGRPWIVHPESAAAETNEAAP